MISRILIAGYGNIGKRHLLLARELNPYADIRILHHKEYHDIPEHANGCFSSIEDAVGFEPNIAIIANPATDHIRVAQKFADTGVHLLVEKPFSASLDGVKKLIATCRMKKIVLMTGYNLRFMRSLQLFRELLKNGVIGQISSIQCEVGQYLPSWRPETDYRNSVSGRKELGGGVLLELSHEFDYLCWIFGDVCWVMGIIGKQGNLDIDVEDTALLILGFDSRENGNQLIGTISMDMLRHDTTRRCTAIGEKGTLRWDGLTGTVEQLEAGISEWQKEFMCENKRNESYREEWCHFLNCIIENRTPMITGEDGVKVLNIIEAVRLSSESGNKVWVERIGIR